MLLAATGCAALSEQPSRSQPAAGPLTHFEKVTLERTPCFGTCPVYRVVILGDGRVEYDGYQFVKVASAAAALSQDQIQSLLTAINKARYFSLRDSYRRGGDGCPSWVTDHPSALTSVTSGGVTKKIDHDLGCWELPAPDGRLGAPYPPELTAFETAIDEIVNTARWVKR
jgi:protein-disulfide isomerase-like protein with CxxC motif